MRLRMFTVVLAALMLIGLQAGADPEQNVNPRRHPNLAAAQNLCNQAYQKLTAAQQANEWDMGGHAKNAKSLLEQASSEIKLAALAANK
jgi:hypothetical protein